MALSNDAVPATLAHYMNSSSSLSRTAFPKGARRCLCGLLALAGALSASAQAVYSSPYVISTLAGAGFVYSGYLDGTGTAAQFNSPYGVAVDSGGNVYVADSANFVIRKITSGGVVTTLAGHAGVSGTADGTGTAAQFGSIRGIASDGSGNLYVTDTTYGTVRKVVIASGSVSTFVPASAGLSQPIGVAVDTSSGNVYIADSGNYVVRKVTSGGSVSILAGSVGNSGGTDGTGSGARFSYPTGVGVGSGGNVYVADFQGNTVRKITSAGAVTTFAGVFGDSGVVDGPVSGAVLNHPYGIAIDSAGDIFMTDNANLVREISAAGTVSTLAGQQGVFGSLNGTGANAWFNSPTGIATNSSGTVIYVSDTINNMIRMGIPYNTAQPPQIQYQPQGVSTIPGGSVILQVTVSGVGLSYQWRLNGSNLSDGGNVSGSLNNTLTITNITTNQAGSYTVVVTNSSGSVTSNPAVVTVSGGGSPPAITTQPASQSVNAGASPTLSVAATNATGYQWQLNGTNISGATNSTLALSNIGTTQRGNYTVVVSNVYGSLTSNVASVLVAANSFLFNISTYGYVGSGTGQDLDAGFFIYGSGTKNILVVGEGPSLALPAYGGNAAYSGLALSAPELTFDGVYPAPTAILGTNAAWGGGQTLINAFKAVYAPVFASNSSDTAITEPVAVNGSNGYTADVTINSGGAGLALVEVDDVDSFTALPAIAPSSYLANISTRGYVGASGGSGSGTSISHYEYLDAGFTIFGSTSQTLLIRAVGPSLNGAPAPTLAKPKLTLYDISGNVIASNTGWGTAPVPGNSNVAAGIQPATAAIIASVYATSLTAGSNDCAMVVTLPSGTSGQGAYTAEVTSADNTSAGVALVEVYNVP
jgi:DNA-binding beta-propeller fold protein YncE